MYVCGCVFVCVYTGFSYVYWRPMGLGGEVCALGHKVQLVCRNRSHSHHQRALERPPTCTQQGRLQGHTHKTNLIDFRFKTQY